MGVDVKATVVWGVQVQAPEHDIEKGDVISCKCAENHDLVQKDVKFCPSCGKKIVRATKPTQKYGFWWGEDDEKFGLAILYNSGDGDSDEAVIGMVLAGVDPMNASEAVYFAVPTPLDTKTVCEGLKKMGIPAQPKLWLVPYCSC